MNTSPLTCIVSNCSTHKTFLARQFLHLPESHGTCSNTFHVRFQCPPYFSWNLFNNPIWLNLSRRSPCDARPFFMDFNVFQRKCDYQYVLPINPPNITTLPFQANNSSSSLLSISRSKDLQKDSGKYQLLVQKLSRRKVGNSILESKTTSL